MIERTLVGKRKNILTDFQKKVLVVKLCNFTDYEAGLILGIQRVRIINTLRKIEKNHCVKRVKGNLNFMEEHGLVELAIQLKPGFEIELKHAKEELKKKVKNENRKTNRSNIYD